MKTINCGRFDLNYIDEGEGFPVVLIHGLAGDHTSWLPYIAEFKNHYRVIAMDNPGSGDSSPVDAPCTMEELADTMIALMDNLQIDKAHVVGRSLGGMTGMHMALRAPDRLQSLVLTPATHKFDRIGRLILENMRDILEWQDDWGDWARHSAHMFVSHDFYNKHPEEMAQILALVGNEARSKVSYLNLNHTALSHDVSTRLGDITCPTLIMAGRLDPLNGIPGADAMSAGIPNSETIIFEKSAHFFLMEEPEKAMTAIRDWLIKHTP